MNGTPPKGTFPGLAAPVGGAASGAQPAEGSRAAQAFAATQHPPAVSATDLPAGLMLGKYQIVRQLGSGGMGAVYEAVHTSIGKPVALKTMNPALASDPRAEARFMREAAAASRLGHPNVCDVTDFGADAGVVYIVMELMRGEDLSALVARAPAGLDVSFVADVMLAVCAGVFAAHEKGVVHRDLKPQNIFLSRTAMGDVVPKVLDFGISKLLDDEAANALTNSGSVMGTTHYLSPEQVMGLPVDGRSDEFALGVILYECLTGQRPHQGDTIFTIMRAISEGRFQRPRAMRPDLSPDAEMVVLRAMGLRPDDRYPTVHALGNALLAFASPKGRVMWGDYFSRPPASALAFSQGNATGGMTSGQFAPTPSGRSGPIGTPQGPGPTMMMGASQVSGDTRSGVGPVSVWGTGELDPGDLRRRTRGPLYALGGAAVAAAAFFIFKPTVLPRQDADESKRAEVSRDIGRNETSAAAKGQAATATGAPAIPTPAADETASGAQGTTEAPPTERPRANGAATAGESEGTDEAIGGTDSRSESVRPRATTKPTTAKATNPIAGVRDSAAVRKAGGTRPGAVRPKTAPSGSRPTKERAGLEPSKGDPEDDLLMGNRKANPESVPILD
ncbi:MAG TPA: serine/threonine-protein kinase [Polyangia bacterium]